MIQAEVRRLSHALAPFGILSRAHLRAEAGSRSWSEGAFETALQAAIRQGVIEPLPCDFYRDATRDGGVSAGPRGSRTGPH